MGGLCSTWLVALCGLAGATASGCGPEQTTSASASASTSTEQGPVGTAPMAAPSASSASSASKISIVSLTQGRKLAREGRWAEAVVAFEQAVAVDPPSAIALSELGWAAFNAGDLELASSATTRGLELTQEPKARAQMFYNRGRIEETRGDRDAAAKSYTASLSLRPNDIVQARLEALGMTAPEAIAPPKPICSKTFSTRREACDCLLGEREALGLPKEEAGSCVLVPIETDATGPSLEVVRVSAGSESVVWVLADVRGRLRPVVELDGGEVAPKKLLMPIASDRSVVSLLFERTSTETGETLRTTLELFCLVGDRANAPRCELTIPHAVIELQDGRPNPDRTTTLARSVTADGKVLVKKQGGPEDLLPKGAVGHHALW